MRNPYKALKYAFDHYIHDIRYKLALLSSDWTIAISDPTILVCVSKA